MGDDLILDVDGSKSAEPLQSAHGVQTIVASKYSSSSHAVDPSVSISTIDVGEDEGTAGEDEPLIQMVECRICQEEDYIKNLEIPCACNGSLKFAHRECVQRWCNEKGGITCEICHQPYLPNYTAAPSVHPEDTAIDISDGWTIAGAPLDLRDPRLLAMAAPERRLLDFHSDEYADSSASEAAFCRSAPIILMALLFLRHALTDDGDADDDDFLTFFSLFFLRSAWIIIPFYIMVGAIILLQHRRQRQGTASLAAAEVPFLLHAGQHRSIQVRITQVPTPTPVPTTAPGPTATDEHVITVPAA